MFKKDLFRLLFVFAIVVGGFTAGLVYASNFTEPVLSYPNKLSFGALSLEGINLSQGVPVGGGDGGTGHYNRNGVLYVASSTGDVYLAVDLDVGEKFYIRDVQDGPRFVLDSAGRVGIGVPAPAYALDVLGDIRAQNAWLRTTGNTGWYSDTHGGGWYMQDSTWIRSYGSKNVYISNGLRADGGIASGVTDLPGAGNIVATGYVKAGGNSTGISTLIGDCEWKWSGWQNASSDSSPDSVQFDSPNCPSGKAPVSCHADCDWDPGRGENYCEDAIVEISPWNSGSLAWCRIKAHDQQGADEYNMRVGALCCAGVPTPF